MNTTEHAHTQDCQHGHAARLQTPHVHGPHCNHGPSEPVRNPLRTVGRNDPCPCGSQKKYKKCHGA